MKFKMPDIDDWLIALLIAVLFLIFAMTSSGCMDSRTSTKQALDREETWTGTMNLSLPYAGADGVVAFRPVPIDLNVRRQVTESTQAEGQKHTDLDAGTLGQVLSTALRGAFPALGATIGAAPSQGWSGTEIGLGTSAAALLAALAKVAVELRSVKKDNDQTYEELKRKALDKADHGST